PCGTDFGLAAKEDAAAAAWPRHAVVGAPGGRASGTAVGAPALFRNDCRRRRARREHRRDWGRSGSGGAGHGLVPGRPGPNAARLEHDREKAWPGLDPGWVPVFGNIMLQA